VEAKAHCCRVELRDVWLQRNPANYQHKARASHEEMERHAAVPVTN